MDMPNPFPGFPGAPTNGQGAMDLEKLKEMFGGQLPPPPQGFPMPGLANGMPIPPGFVPPPGFPPFPPQPPTESAQEGGSSRRRAPLPSQQESLQAEMRQGRYTKPR